MYRIGEFSKMLKVTVKTLRFYEEVGLLYPSFVDASTNYRYYTFEQINPLHRILTLRRAGLSIEEIKRVLSGQNVDVIFEEREAQLRWERDDIEDKISRLITIKRSYKEEQIVNYQAVIKELPEYIVYFKRFTANSYAEYGSIIPQIGADILAANPNLKCSEPSFCYVEGLDGEYREEDIHAEYAEAVEEVGVETNGIKFKRLPKTTVAAAMVKGGYENISGGYTYLVQWIEDNGYEMAGNGREQYIDGCWNKSSPDDYLTEIQIPIKKRG